MITKESLQETETGKLTVEQKEQCLFFICEKNYPEYTMADIKRLVWAAPTLDLNQFVNAIIYAQEVAKQPYSMRTYTETVKQLDIDKI